MPAMTLSRFVRGSIGDVSPEGHAQCRQAAWFVGLVALVVAMSLAHAGPIAKPLFVFAGLYGAQKYRRRSPWLLITWSLWFWTVTPFVRRIIEWHAGFTGHDPVLVTPNLIELFMLPDILSAPGLLRRPAVRPGLVILIPLLYGLFNSFVRGDIFGGLFSAADWIAPLLYFFFIALHADRLASLTPALRTFFALNFGLLIPYAFYQFLYMTPWDRLWLMGTGLATDEQASGGNVRVFGTFTNPGFLAAWLGFGMVMVTTYWTRIQIVLLPVAGILIFLTLSRSVYLSTGLGFAALVIANRPRHLFRTGVTLAAAGITLAAILSVAEPEITARISDRLTSMTHLQDDTSAQIRREIWARTPAEIDDAPFGLGIGATGRGAIASNGQEVVIDSGILAIYLGLGWVFGTAYLLGMFGMVASALVAARRARSREAGANASASLVILGLLPFINIGGFGGVILWGSLALATAHASQARATGARPARPSPSAGHLHIRRASTHA